MEPWRSGGWACWSHEGWGIRAEKLQADKGRWRSRKPEMHAKGGGGRGEGRELGNRFCMIFLKNTCLKFLLQHCQKNKNLNSHSFSR